MRSANAKLIEKQLQPKRLAGSTMIDIGTNDFRSTVIAGIDQNKLSNIAHLIKCIVEWHFRPTVNYLAMLRRRPYMYYIL